MKYREGRRKLKGLLQFDHSVCGSKAHLWSKLPTRKMFASIYARSARGEFQHENGVQLRHLSAVAALNNFP